MRLELPAWQKFWEGEKTRFDYEIAVKSQELKKQQESIEVKIAEESKINGSIEALMKDTVELESKKASLETQRLAKETEVNELQRQKDQISLDNAKLENEKQVKQKEIDDKAQQLTDLNDEIV